MLPIIYDYLDVSNKINDLKIINKEYKNYNNYQKYLDDYIISLININIPYIITFDNKIIQLKKFNEIEWLDTKPCLKIGFLINTNDEIWYVEYSYHEGFKYYYHSSISDFLINCINNIKLSYNTLSLQPELYTILHYLTFLKINPDYDYILIERNNNYQYNYTKFLCKYNNRIYYILYDLKKSQHSLFCL